MTTTNTRKAFEIRRAADRGASNLGWLQSRHSFSFGRYYDPARMGFRSLRVINDDVVRPGAGFGEHGHDNMEILTWVLDGALRHGDSLGHDMVLRPGELQAMTAGTGIRHSEFNASATAPVHFLQIWIEPDTPDMNPRYDQRAFDAAGRANRWQTLATGREADADGVAMPIRQDATLRIAELSAGATVDVTVAPGRAAYVHVATGSVIVGDDRLTAGDALVQDAAGTQTLTAEGPTQVLWFDLG